MPEDLIRIMRKLFPPAAETAWEPATDVYQTPCGWLVKLDLAGVRPEDVQLVACGNRLHVRGVRRDCSLEEGCTHYRMEIAYSKFERNIVLPVDIEQARVATEFRHGLLLIRIEMEACK
jgi:HSP20 family protein